MLGSEWNWGVKGKGRIGGGGHEVMGEGGDGGWGKGGGVGGGGRSKGGIRSAVARLASLRARLPRPRPPSPLAGLRGWAVRTPTAGRLAFPPPPRAGAGRHCGPALPVAFGLARLPRPATTEALSAGASGGGLGGPAAAAEPGAVRTGRGQGGVARCRRGAPCPRAVARVRTRA